MSSSRGGGKPFYSLPTQKSNFKAGTSGSKQPMLPSYGGAVRGNYGFPMQNHLGRGSGSNSRAAVPMSPAGRGNGKPPSANRDFGTVSNPPVVRPPLGAVANPPVVRPPLKTGCSWSGVASANSVGNGPYGTLPVVQPPLKPGLSWSNIVASNNSLGNGPDEKKHDPNSSHPSQVAENGPDDKKHEQNSHVVVNTKEDDADSCLTDETEDEFFSDDIDSDTSEKSYESRKKNRWLKSFFESIESLTIEEINKHERKWHCPACQGGPGAIDWFTGLLPLALHAKTKRTRRVKLHKEFAKLLEEELNRMGSNVGQPDEALGKWKGLENEESDFAIVWPPMVMVMNTRSEKDENDGWTGMGNKKLLEYFDSYAAIKARHSYGPKGHRGISVLIFEASAVGYIEAERLSKHFADAARDRDAWERNPMRFYPGGERILYGYMAEKRDLDDFNRHSHGKLNVRFEMRSHREMVVEQIRRMDVENQQLICYKNKAAKQQKQVKALQESVTFVGEKYRQTAEENKIVRSKIKQYHEENKDEMEFQGEFFKESFEKMQKEQFDKVNLPCSVIEHHQQRLAEIANYREFNQKSAMEEIIAVKEKLKKAHEEQIDAMRRRHREEEAELKKMLDVEMAVLMEHIILD